MKQLPLIYAVNPTKVFKYLGYPIFMLGLSILVPFLASLALGEWELSIPYLSVGLVSIVLGRFLVKLPVKKSLRMNEAIVIICLTYLYSVTAASIPLMFSGFAPVDAIFEAISGVTTTGLSMITDYSRFPDTTYFSRAWLQWVGGIGIMLFSLAFLIDQGAISKKFSALESNTTDIIGGSKLVAKGIIIIYLSLTLAGILFLSLTSLSTFNATLLTFATVSTGGFSQFPDSIASLSAIQQIFITLLAFACAISLPFYYRLWHQGIDMNLQGAQAFGLLILSIAISLILGSTFGDWVLGFSAQTTTGFSSINVAELGAGQKTSLCFSMLVGGGIGSTAGGFKILRLLFFFLLVKTLIIGRSQSRHAVIRNTIFNYQVTKEQFYQASAIIILYGLVTFFSGLCFIFYGYPAVDSFFEVTSAVGTVGLSAGITGPDLPLFLKAVLSFDMLLGRLEIFPWLIVLFPATWLSQKLEEG